jgi:hypothetical protein
MVHMPEIQLAGHMSECIPTHTNHRFQFEALLPDSVVSINSNCIYDLSVKGVVIFHHQFIKARPTSKKIEGYCHPPEV